ncbi:MAG TPA: hypothetical protein PLA25_13040 [Anaerolineaceae bacterium]|nr:hypothetical protein [Anaerolineaceae bacterium]
MTKPIIVALVAGAVAAFVFALIGPGAVWISCLAGGGLTTLAVWGLFHVWRWAGGRRSLAWILILAFVLRLGVGIALHLLLPIYGDDEPVQNAGYVFYDAWQRDQQSWQLAQSDQALFSAFGSEFYSDQYGGLLWLGSLIYRFLSPDAQRPMLMVILGAFTAAVGAAFLIRAVQSRFDPSIALVAGWIYALYPESILQGASQMREPFLMGLSAIAWWAVIAIPRTPIRWHPLAALIAASLGLMVLSWRAALPISGASNKAAITAMQSAPAAMTSAALRRVMPPMATIGTVNSVRACRIRSRLARLASGLVPEAKTAPNAT